MKTIDQAPMIVIAMPAARADGSVDSAEQRAVDAVAARRRAGSTQPIYGR